LRPQVEARAFAELAYFGGGFTIARIANYLAVNGDNLVVGRFLGPTTLGYYGRAHSLMAAPAYAFGTVLDQVLFPAMARVQDDPTRLAAAYRRGVALIALLVLPASAVLVLLAPELIRAVLGAKWGAVVVPFQILGLGMLFRTSYKMSDSIARSTGAVYRRAWRQILYAVLVLAATGLGTRWGIVGVSWGALAALTVNFILMAGLGLEVAQLPWRRFWDAHRPAVLLTAVSFPCVWGAVVGLRSLDLPAVVVLAVAGGVRLLVCGGLVWRAPGVFLGADGQWMASTMRSFVQKLARSSGRRPKLSGAYEPTGPRESR